MKFSENFKGFLDEIYEFIIRNNGYTTFFRGQKRDLPLNAGIFRIPELREIERIKRKEEHAYRMFINHGAPFLNGEVDWQLLFIMQHHGTPTRLLDWSTSLITSLYFATQNISYEDSPVLWLLNAEKLNGVNGPQQQEAMILPPFGLEYLEVILDPTPFFQTVAVTPTRNTNRQVMQRGVFTIQGDYVDPLDREMDGFFIKEEILKKINIPLDIIPDIKDYLFINGVDHFSIYPDLDGLSSIISQRLNPRSFL